MGAAAVMTMSARGVSFRVPVLPWAASVEDDARFRRISGRVLTGALLLCLALPWLPVSKEVRVAAVPVAQPPVRLVLPELSEPPPPPPPPAVAPMRTPVPAEAAPAAAAKPQRDLTTPKAAAPVPEARNPQPDKPPGEAIDAARRKAAGVGLLAMKDQLAELQGAPVAVQLKPELVKPGPGVGTGTGVGVGAGSEPGLPTRALITSNAAGGSGGINTSGYSRDTGGGGLAGRSTTLVAGVASGGGGGGGARAGKGDGVGAGSGNGTGGAGAGGAGTRGGGAASKASRSIEEIKVVFDRNKGAIYAIYNRALREEPGLQGKVVVELKIAPSGAVVDCRVVSSELHAAELESKLLARIRQFDFGAKEVEPKVVTWPLDFLPS
jgi:protein TonB